MALFSQRKGLKPIQKPLQIAVIDDELRNSLWNCLHIYVWKRGYQRYSISGEATQSAKEIHSLSDVVWIYFFKKPIDNAPDYWGKVKEIRDFFFSGFWYELFDLMEFVYANAPHAVKGQYEESCNYMLKQENSGYRLLNGQFIEITSDEELSEIQEARSTPLQPVNDHIHRAAELFSDRKNPDYRNSIKESISAVEAICRILSQDQNAELSKALAILESNSLIHGSLKKSFKALYGYTSDEDGIRHAMLEEDKVTFTDAKYMLVSCSAFVNYLIGKAMEAGIGLSGV